MFHILVLVLVLIWSLVRCFVRVCVSLFLCLTDVFNVQRRPCSSKHMSQQSAFASGAALPRDLASPRASALPALVVMGVFGPIVIVVLGAFADDAAYFQICRHSCFFLLFVSVRIRCRIYLSTEICS